MWWDSVIGPAKNEVFKWLPEAWIILFFLTIFSVLRWLKIFSRPAVPKVTVSRKSEKNKMSKMINQMTILQKPFVNFTIAKFIIRFVTPKLWGRSGHVQTAIYGALKHPSLTRRSAQRILLPLADGSTSSFDLFEPIDQHQSGHDITLVLTPGITNSSESNYIKTCVHHALDHGFRCAALNHIGVLASEQVTGNRIFNYGMIDELEAMMDYLGENYPKMFFITIGFSMGANQTTLYLLRTPKERRPRLLMGMSICQGYSATVSMPMYHDWMQGRRFYNQMIAENVKRLLRRNYATVVAPHVKSGRLDEGKLWASSSIAALDENYNRRVVDRPSLDDFYNWCSCLPHLEKLDLPMIFLNTDDDPVIPAELFEPVQKMCEERDDMAFVRTKHGGHLGFLEGDSFSPSSITWLDKFIVEAANRAISTYAH